jgi:hypothetical protein
MKLPACTGFGDATLLTVNSPRAVLPTTVVTKAVLFAVFGSLTDELTDAVPVMTVPLAVPAFTVTPRVNVADVNPVMLTLVQTTLPVPPPASCEQLHPGGDVRLKKVVFAGVGSTSVALSAALGPALETTTV